MNCRSDIYIGLIVVVNVRCEKRCRLQESISQMRDQFKDESSTKGFYIITEKYFIESASLDTSL